MHGPQTQIAAETTTAVADRLLDWYERYHRDLPWRVPPAEARAGAKADPYRVWLSEIMLQQTQVETVKPYFAGFLARWPNVSALSRASAEEVLAAWAGLGYYSRARNLKRCADMVASVHRGRFPDTAAELKALPGIGDYTSAAIAAIAFGRPEAAIDGNVERVVCRLAAIGLDKARARSLIRETVSAIMPPERPGDFAQALMDLGATVCTPRRPDCARCPLNRHCAAFAAGEAERYPVRVGRKEKPLRRGAAFVALRPDGAILVRRRAGKGLLAGMTEVPTTAWTAKRDGDTGPAAAPLAADWHRAGIVEHVFTHFRLELCVYRAEGVTSDAPGGCRWAAGLAGEALPTLFRKVIERAMAEPAAVSAGPERRGGC